MKIKNRTIYLSEKDQSSSEAFDRVLNKFQKQINKLGILKIVRDKKYFIKKSEIKHKKDMERKHKAKLKKVHDK